MNLYQYIISPSSRTRSPNTSNLISTVQSQSIMDHPKKNTQIQSQTEKEIQEYNVRQFYAEYQNPAAYANANLDNRKVDLKQQVLQVPINNSQRSNAGLNPKHTKLKQSVHQHPLKHQEQQVYNNLSDFTPQANVTRKIQTQSPNTMTKHVGISFVDQNSMIMSDANIHKNDLSIIGYGHGRDFINHEICHTQNPPSGLNTSIKKSKSKSKVVTLKQMGLMNSIEFQKLPQDIQMHINASNTQKQYQMPHMTNFMHIPELQKHFQDRVSQNFRPINAQIKNTQAQQQLIDNLRQATKNIQQSSFLPNIQISRDVKSKNNTGNYQTKSLVEQRGSLVVQSNSAILGSKVNFDHDIAANIFQGKSSVTSDLNMYQTHQNFNQGNLVIITNPTRAEVSRQKNMQRQVYDNNLKSAYNKQIEDLNETLQRLAREKAEFLQGKDKQNKKRKQKKKEDRTKEKEDKIMGLEHNMQKKRKQSKKKVESLSSQLDHNKKSVYSEAYELKQKDWPNTQDFMYSAFNMPINNTNTAHVTMSNYSREPSQTPLRSANFEIDMGRDKFPNLPMKMGLPISALSQKVKDPAVDSQLKSRMNYQVSNKKTLVLNKADIIMPLADQVITKIKNIYISESLQGSAQEDEEHSHQNIDQCDSLQSEINLEANNLTMPFHREENVHKPIIYQKPEKSNSFISNHQDVSRFHAQNKFNSNSNSKTSKQYTNAITSQDFYASEPQSRRMLQKESKDGRGGGLSYTFEQKASNAISKTEKTPKNETQNTLMNEDLNIQLTEKDIELKIQYSNIIASPLNQDDQNNLDVKFDVPNQLTYHEQSRSINLPQQNPKGNGTVQLIDELRLTQHQNQGHKKNLSLKPKEQSIMQTTRNKQKTPIYDITPEIPYPTLDVSSDEGEIVKSLQLGTQFKPHRKNFSFCQQYIQFKGCQLSLKYNNLFTINKFRRLGSKFVISQRLFLSLETVTSEDRRMMPVLIINIDGILGFWNKTCKHKHFVLRPGIIDELIKLSYDFRIVGVSSMSQKFIQRLVFGLLNVPPQGETLNSEDQTKSIRHLVFDAVYQINSESHNSAMQSKLNYVDKLQFDLSQVLLDLQFKKPESQDQSKSDKTPDHSSTSLKPESDKFLTFWESHQYKPHKKVIILTTEKHFIKNKCYSYDFTHIFQASQFENDESKTAPLIIQLPHFRLNPSISINIARQVLFLLQNITYVNLLTEQENVKDIRAKAILKPEATVEQVIKKLISSSLKKTVVKNKQQILKFTRVFDDDTDPYVDLENIDFTAAFLQLKEKFTKKSNWLQIHKFYLRRKTDKVDLEAQKKPKYRVTFIEQPIVNRVGEEIPENRCEPSIISRAGLTHDSTKPDSVSTRQVKPFKCDDSMNHYNAMMIRNYNIQQEINSYARHYRIQNQKKLSEQNKSKQSNNNNPVVLYDRDNEKLNLKSCFKATSSFNKKKKVQKQKPYFMKYHVLKIRCDEVSEIWDNDSLDFRQYNLISLRKKVDSDLFKAAMSVIKDSRLFASQSKQTTLQPHQLAAKNTYQHIYEEGNFKTKTPIYSSKQPNALISLLSKRQNPIQYLTNQEQHLVNNLNQLVDGRTTYLEQQKQLDLEEEMVLKEQRKPLNKTSYTLSYQEAVDYLDKL